MKAARLRFSAEALSGVIGLPPGARIVHVWQDADDLAYSTVSIIIHGIGQEMVEGAAVPTLTLEKLSQDGVA